MFGNTDSYNCVDAVFDSRTATPAPPRRPLSPKLLEIIRKEQELLKRAKGIIPPPIEVVFPPEPGTPPVAQ